MESRTEVQICHRYWAETRRRTESGGISSRHGWRSWGTNCFRTQNTTSCRKPYSQLDIHNWSIIFVIKNQADFKWKTIIILTDHKSFLGIFNSIRTISNYMSPKMLRWTLVLGAYQYDIKYREGKRYRHADALSRLPLKMLVSLFQKFPIYTVEKIKPNS